MKPVIVQEKSDSGALWVYIPKHIVEHFGIKKGDKLYVDWDESDPENPKIIYHLKKPERSVCLGSSPHPGVVGEEEGGVKTCKQ